MSPDPVCTLSTGPPPRTWPWIDFLASCTRPCTVIVIGASISSVPELVERSASKSELLDSRTCTLPEPVRISQETLCVPSAVTTPLPDSPRYHSLKHLTQFSTHHLFQL